MLAQEIVIAHNVKEMVLTAGNATWVFALMKTFLHKAPLCIPPSRSRRHVAVSEHCVFFCMDPRRFYLRAPSEKDLMRWITALELEKQVIRDTHTYTHTHTRARSSRPSIIHVSHAL
jgi:hypothetical protein